MDEPDNMVLELLRRIRADIDATKTEMRTGLADVRDDLAELLREFGDVREANANAMGHIDQGNVTPRRLDRELINRQNRVTALEVTVAAPPEQ